MQRAAGQYDHFARVPRARPRQSRGRRSFASRRWCRATPRSSGGMVPTVRGARIEPAIIAARARNRAFWPPKTPNSRAAEQYLPLESLPPGTEFLDAETEG